MPLRQVLTVTAAVIGVALSGGCGDRLPPVSEELLVRARQTDALAKPAALEHGRVLLITRCASCHALPAPKSQPVDAWPQVVGSMAKRSRLTSVEQADLLRYVLVASAMGTKEVTRTNGP